MKLAIVSPYPPSKGTLNEYAFHLVQQFKDKAEVTEIILITDKLPEGVTYPKSLEGDHIKKVDAWEFNSLTNALKIRKAVNEYKPDVVLYNIQFLSFGDKKVPGALGLLAPLITRWSGVPSMVLLHNIIETVDLQSAGITNNPIMKGIYNLSGTILTRLILSADMVAVTISKYVEILEEKYKVKNVALVPHGSFELPPLPDYNLPSGPLKVMTFGKFGTYKKVEILIDAIQLVRSRTDLDIEVVIAGTDNPNVKGYLQRVQTKYEGIPGLTFTGYVEEEDVPRIFTESAICVFPYTSTTGSSGVLHQAGSYGKATILPIIGDLKSLIEEEGYAGAYYEPDDTAGLADAIEKVLINEEYRTHLASSNYAAAASLPMADIVDWYLIHFKELIESKKRHTTLV